MKKSLLLLTTVLAFNVSNLSASEAPLADASERDDNLEGVAAVERSSSPGSIAITSTIPVLDVQSSLLPAVPPAAVASAHDLDRIKSHILGYAEKLGLPSEVKTVGSTGCFACCSTTFDAAQRFLLNELAGQLLTRFLALALDDLADGKLDGIAYGKKISYAREITSLLGLEISEEELRATAPLDTSLLMRVGSFAMDVTQLILENVNQKDKLLEAAGAFAKKKMNEARKSLTVALIQESDRIIALELGNGAIDGLDARGLAIDWKKEMETSIKNSLSRVLGGVF